MTDLARRTLIRMEFASLLRVSLVGDGKPVQDVFPYTVVDFAGHSPVVVVGSAGTERVPFTMGGSRRSLLIDTWVYVLYADVVVDEAGNVSIRLSGAGDEVWNEEASEAALDLIEELISGILDEHPRAANWKSVEYAAPTDAGFEIIGEQMYRRERIPVRFNWF